MQSQMLHLSPRNVEQAGGPRRCRHQLWHTQASTTTNCGPRSHGKTRNEGIQGEENGCNSSEVVKSTCVSSLKNLRATNFPLSLVSCPVFCDYQPQQRQDERKYLGQHHSSLVSFLLTCLPPPRSHFELVTAKKALVKEVRLASCDVCERARSATMLWLKAASALMLHTLTASSPSSS